MKKKIIHLAVFVFILLGILLVYRSCTRIEIKELETLQRELKRSDKNIKSIKFYFLRPNHFCTEIVYDGEIRDWGLMNIISHFKKTINHNLMVEISDIYPSLRFPIDFNIYVYRDFAFGDIPSLYEIYVYVENQDSDDRKDIKYYIIKNNIDSDRFDKRIKQRNSYIYGFVFLIGGTILFILLCVFFARYLKKRGY